MTQVYVDAETLTIGGGGELGLDPESVRALRLLADAGHRVALVTPGGDDALPTRPREAAAELGEIDPARVAEAPAVPQARAWYLTTDVARCQGPTARLRTVLIGAALPTGSIHRCDAVARDLHAAALELMASEATSLR